MKTTLLTVFLVVIAQVLLACSSQATHPDRGESRQVSSSHSIYLEGGVLKVFAHEEHQLLYVYVRPEFPGRWVATGGGGGNPSDPWQHKSSVFWTLGDAHGEYLKDGPHKAFTCVFDSQQMTLSVETGTYAVRRGDFVVIALDENWRPSTVSSGLDALRSFDLPEAQSNHLMAASRKYYYGVQD